MSLKQRISPFYIVLPVILLANTASFCQWKKVFQFTQEVRTVYFLDKIGHPEIGYCGLRDGELWKSVDTGKTWEKIFASPDIVSISDINFKDISTGWIVTKLFPFQTGLAAIYNTTDGGVTWQLQKASAQGYSAVYYHAPSSTLFLSEWYGGAYYSSDDGNSWNTFTTQSPLNGFSFSNDLTGILTFAGAVPTTMMLTTDGGALWNVNPEQAYFTSCWQPAAKPGTNTFFVFSEYTGFLTRSDDAGVTWKKISSIGSSAQHELTGTLRISDCNEFFVQSDLLDSGFYLSTDEGATWINCGGPSSEADTRFWINGKKVFAADLNGGLSSFDGGAAILHLTQKNFFISSLDCKPVNATFNFQSVSCITEPDSVISSTITGPFSLTPASAPQHFITNGLVNIIYTPTGKGADTGVLTLHLLLHGRIVDTTITVFATSPKQITTLSLPASSFSVISPDCGQIDTTVQFFSYTNCEPGVDTIIGASFIRGTGFSISSTEIFPRKFTSNDSIIIIYQPSGAISDTSILFLRTMLGGKEKDTAIHFIGQPVKPIVNFSLKLLPIKDTTFGIALSADVPASEGLDSLDFDLHFDPEIIKLNGAIEPAGFAITIQEISPGFWKCRFYNNAHSAILANQSLGMFHFLEYVSIDTVIKILLAPGNVFFDPKIHSGCALALMSQNDSIIAPASNNCGNGLLRRYMATGNLDIILLSIKPNPASDEIIIETKTAHSLEANIIIYNDLGKELINRKQIFSGRNSVTIPISFLESGNYHCMIKSAAGSISSDFVKLR